MNEEFAYYVTITNCPGGIQDGYRIMDRSVEFSDISAKFQTRMNADDS